MESLALAWKKDHGSVLPDDWKTNAVMHQWMLQRMRMDEHDLPSYMQVKRRMISQLHTAEIEQLFAEDDG